MLAFPKGNPNRFSGCGDSGPVGESSEHNPVAPDRGGRMAQLWRRLKDHRIAQWAVGYIALAYAIQHGVVLTTESMDWPHAIERVSMILLALGLPVATALAWYHGGAVNRRVSGGELSIISLLLVIGAFLFYTFAQPQERTATAPAPPQQPNVAANGISLAVLPFVNLSADKDQEFFSDGMTEEINAALAKVQDLRVIARASAFQFKGQNQDVRSVGQALGASHLIEGSVRKAGDRVRITAQLVRSGDGVQLWSENYDRNLTDIFAIQEDIAQAIAGALRVPLGLAQGETLIRDRTDIESYDQFLRAKALVRAREDVPEQLIATLEALVAHDPNYAPAWTLLSNAYFGTLDFRALRTGSIESSRAIVQASQNKIEQAARKALQADSRQAGAYASLAEIQFNRAKWAEAEDLFKQALALDPNDPNIVYGFTGFLRAVGRNREALPLRDRVRILEPLSSIYNSGFGAALMISKQNEQAIAVLESLPPGARLRHVYLAQAYASAKRYAEAADTLLAIPPQASYSRRSIEDAARLLRAAPATVKEPTALPALEGELGFVYGYIGAMSRVLEFPERNLEIGFAGDNLARMLWHPDYAPLRKTERFKAYLRKAGLVDYWKARGWPDLCHPIGTDDFACN